jgi:hypothetical protein
MKNYLLFVAIIVVFGGCKKDVDVSAAALLSKTWKMTAMEVITPLQGTPLQGSSSNWFSNGCFHTMLWNFKPGRVFEHMYDAGCQQQGFTNFAGVSWRLINNDQQVAIEPTTWGNFNLLLYNCCLLN